jgi:SYP6 family syntaxin
MSETLKTATAAPAMSVHESKMIASNDKFVRSEYEQQQLVVKEQDQHLEDIEQAVTRLGRVGLDIHKVGARR